MSCSATRCYAERPDVLVQPWHEQRARSTFAAFREHLRLSGPDLKIQYMRYYYYYCVLQRKSAAAEACVVPAVVFLRVWYFRLWTVVC